MKSSKSKSDPIPILAYARTNCVDASSTRNGSIEKQFEAIEYWAKYNNCKVVG